jgi:hypothetical protein
VPSLNQIADSYAVIVAAEDSDLISFGSLLAPTIRLIHSPDSLIHSFKASRTPMVYRIDGCVVGMRGIPNTLVGLEDLLDGVGTSQGTRGWRPVEGGGD